MEHELNHILNARGRKECDIHPARRSYLFTDIRGFKSKTCNWDRVGELSFCVTIRERQSERLILLKEAIWLVYQKVCSKSRERACMSVDSAFSLALIGLGFQLHYFKQTLRKEFCGCLCETKEKKKTIWSSFSLLNVNIFRCFSCKLILSMRGRAIIFGFSKRPIPSFDRQTRLDLCYLYDLRLQICKVAKALMINAGMVERYSRRSQQWGHIIWWKLEAKDRIMMMVPRYVLLRKVWRYIQSTRSLFQRTPETPTA